MITKLTESLIATLQCPDDKRRMEVCDSDLPGLYVLIRAGSAVKTYFVRYKNTAGKTAHMKLGRTTEMTLAKARKATKAFKASLLVNGPAQEEPSKPQKGEMTLDTFWTDHYLPYATPRKRSIKRDEQLFRLQIQPTLGQLRLNEITRQQVLNLAAFHKENGLSAASADHVTKLTARLLNLAVEWDMLEKNPAAKIQLFREDNRVEHYLNDKQLRTLMQILETDPNRPVCLLCQFLLATGCRVGEALTAEWRLIDRQTRTWTVAASVSKSGRARAVPLTEAALRILDRMGTEGQYPFVFTNLETGERYTNIRPTWIRLREKAGLPWLRLHDLRHTYASMLVNAGQSLYVVQQCLGHADGRVTQRYAHLSTKTLHDAADLVSMKMLGATQAAE